MKNTVYTQKSLFEAVNSLGFNVTLRHKNQCQFRDFYKKCSALLGAILFFLHLSGFGQGISTCTTISDLWAAPGKTLTINGTTVSLSAGLVGTAVGSAAGQGSPVANFLNTSAIGSTNASTIDNNVSGWRDYIWIRVHFDTPTMLLSPFRFQDVDGNAGSNAEIVTIIGQNGSTVVTPTYTAGSSLAGASTGTINDPTGITLGAVTAYRQTGSYASNTDDPRNILTADFGSQLVTDVYFMWGAAGNTTATAPQYGTISSSCFETTIPSPNPACTTPPYKVYEYNRPGTTNTSNVPVQIIGATTTNVTLDQRTTGTDLTYGGVDWKLLSSNIVPDATNKIDVKLVPTTGTNGTYLFADAILISNGFNTIVLDNNDPGYSQVGTWITQTGFTNAYLGDNNYATAGPYAGRTATWSFTNLPTAVTPPTPVPLSNTIAYSCLKYFQDLTALVDSTNILPAGYTYEWHSVASNPTAATLVPNPTKVTSSGPFYLYIMGPAGCVSLASAPVTGNTLPVCKDWDSDGVPDDADLDDDNDGILDTVEENCPIALSMPYENVGASNFIQTTYAGMPNGGIGNGTGTTGTGAIGTNNFTINSNSLLNSRTVTYSANSGAKNILDNYSANATIAAHRIATFDNFTTPLDYSYRFSFVDIDANEIGRVSAQDCSGNPIDMTNWTVEDGDLTTGYTVSSTTNQLTVTGTANNNGIIVFKPPFGVQICSITFDVTAPTANVGVPIFIEKINTSSCNNDTDGDSKPNSCDTDSDGDGCPDAVEAGVLPIGQSTVTAPYGANGLANSIESNDTQTATLTNVPNYSLLNYTGNSLSNTVNLCNDDCDNDGIPNVFDLDDDNDGVPDKTEMNCGLTQTWSGSAGVYEANITPDLKVRVTFTGTTWSGITPIANFARNCLDPTYLSDYEPLSNTGKPGLQFNVNGGSVGATFKVEYLNAANQPVTVNNPRMHLGGLGGSYGTGTIGSSDWTLTGGDTQTLLANDAVDFGATSTTIFHPRLFGPGSGVGDCATGEGSGTLQINGPQSSYSYSVDMNGNTFDQMIVLFEGCSEMDTDNDGKPNTCDLDSDGDGCSDAFEAGATSSKTANYTFAAPYGANGLANSLENNDTQTTTTLYTSTYNTYALDSTATGNKCNLPDCDNDGVPDVIDIDDDNDGVLDVVECDTYTVFLREPVFAGYSPNVPVVVNGANGNINYTWNQTIAPNDITYNSLGWTRVASNVIPNAGQIKISIDLTASVTGSFVGLDAALILNNKTGIYTLIDNSNPPTGGFSTTGTWLYNTGIPSNFVNATQTRADAPLAGKSASYTFSGLAACTASCNLDSDGDGCSDAYEAGATTDKTANYTFAGPYGSNGLANSLENNDTPTATTSYTSTYNQYASNATLNLCSDCDKDGIPDLIDIDDDNDGILDTIENQGSIPFTGAGQSFVVPCNVTQLNVKLWGAGGAGGNTFYNSGGSGGFTSATIPVTPGETLTLIVGQGGKNRSPIPTYGGGGAGGTDPFGGLNGASGGGRTEIRRGSTTLVVAGGGGGAGSNTNDATSGSSHGGGGGGLTGLNAKANGQAPNGNGKGGTQTAGGAGGIILAGNSNNGFTGSQYQGGNGGPGGASNGGAGGGGGGGWYGGGGGSGYGAEPYQESAGGGGSGYAFPSATNVVMENGSIAIGGATVNVPAANSADANYIAGVGVGGSSNGNSATVSGGNGLIYIAELADFDNDGIKNSCDLDSDGDGCPDAVEAGLKTTKSDSVFVGAVGANGLVNSIETNDTQTATVTNAPFYSAANYLANALSCTINICADDCDNDGVPNLYDIDDDNDGVLDNIECPSYKVYTYNRVGTFSTNAPFTITGTISQNVIVNQSTAGTDLTSNGVNWKLMASDVLPDASNKITVSLLPTAATNASFLVADAMLITNGVNTYIVDNSATSGFVTSGTWVNQNFGANYLASETYSNAPHTGKTATWTFSNLPALSTYCDTDGDGKPNSCDLDSDGDGCSDAFEAGATTDKTANYTFAGNVGANGLANSIETNDTQTAGVNLTPTYSFATNALYNACNAPQCTSEKLTAAQMATIPAGSASYTYPSFGNTNTLTISRTAGTQTMGNIPSGTLQGIHLGAGIPNNKFEDYAMEYSTCVASMSLSFRAINNNVDGREEIQDFKVFDCNGTDITSSVSFAYTDKSVAPHPTGGTAPYTIFDQTTRTIKGTQGTNCATLTPGADTGAGGTCCDDGGMLTIVSSIPFKKITYRREGRQSVLPSCSGLSNSNGVTLSDSITWCTVCVKPLAGNDTTVCAGTAMNLTGKSPTTGTWSAQTGNPAGATLGTTTGGIANVAFNTTASGNYNFIYTAAACSDTMRVIVTPLPAAPANPTASPSTICVGQSSTLSATCATGTLSWYSNAALTTAITSPVSPTTTTTYYAACVSGTCKSSSANVVVTVEPIPAVPTNAMASPASICIGQSSVLSATCVSPAVATWYTNVGLTTPLVSTTVSPTSTTTYYVTCKNTTLGCESTASTVTVTVNPLPAAPTSATSNTPTICGTGNVTLSAVCAAGTVPYWYSDAAGTSAPLAIGTTNTGSVILAISTTTTYYAFCKNTTTLCQSDAALPVTVTVIPKPTTPTNPLASPSTICAGDASVLSATCASGSAIWYQNSNFTSPLASPTVTPVATTTYYVRCEGSGCVSDLGSQVTVTVTPTPTAATSVSAAPATICTGGSSVLSATCTTGTVAWYTNAGLTTALPSTTVTPTVTTTYYVRCENNGCFGPVSSQIVTVNPTPTAPSITPLATTICSSSSTDLTASGCTGTVNWFVQGNTASIGTGNTLTVSPTATTIYEANCTVGTCSSPNSSPATVTVVTAPASPSISVSDNAICAGGSVTLTAQSCAGTLEWFKDGNSIGTGLTLTDTPTVNAVYTATCNGNGAVSCSTPANANLSVAVNPLPTAPTVTPTASNICSGSSTTLTATGCAAAETVNWSNGQTGSSISVSPAFTTSYTAKCVNPTTGCESVQSSPAAVTVNQTPTTAPTGTATPTAICSGTSATLTAGTCSVGNPIWYTDAGLTTTLPSTNVSPTVTTSYFVACENNGCKGPSEEVIVTVTATPTQPTAVSASLPTICSGGSSTLTATCSVGTPIWYTNIGLTTTLASTTVSPIITTTYAVICNNNGCKSPASTQMVTVNATPLSPTGVSASPPAICSGASSTLSATCPVGSPVWYSNVGLTTQLASNIVTPTATTTYYVRCESNGCFGPSEPITVTVTATPNSPATAAAMPNPLCLGANAVLSATCSTGTLKWYSDVALTTVQTATTVSPTANTNYYAVCDLNGCVSTPTTVSLVVNNCAKTDTVIVTPPCPTCPTPPICATGDDLPSTGTATYQNCGLTPAQSTQGTLITDANGCVIWKPNGMQTDTIKTCVIKCVGAVCDTTVIIIPPPIKPDTTTITPPCPTCPTPAICATADDIIVNSSTTYSMCPVTPSGQGTATLDANNCLIFTPNGSQIDTVKTCIIACTNGKCDTTYIVIPPALESPKIAIVKGSNLDLGTDGVASVGDIITYSYDVTNTGNVPLTGVNVVESATSFTGTGTLPSPTFVSATAGSSATNLLVGGSAVFTATYAITAADIAAGKVDNSAFANGLSPKNVAVKDTSDSKNPNDYNETGTPSDPNGEDKTGTPIAENPKIAIVKGSVLNLGTDGVASVGDIITYSYNVSNTGNVPLTGVSVVESAASFSGTGTLPSPTFVSATAGSSAMNLLVGGSAVFTATYAITAADIAAGKVDNSAFANGLSPKNVAVKDTSDSKNPADYNETGTPSDPNGKDKTGTPIAENPKIAIVKGSALNLGTDGIATVGDIITYSYDVTNTGNVPLTGVSVVESATSFTGTGTLPSPTFVSATAGSSATNLLVGGSSIFTANYAITAADIAAGKVDNSAFANGLSPKNVAVKDTSDSKNPADYNETGTPSDPNGKDKTGTPIAENPKIAIVKGSALNLGTDNVATVGDIITYSYDVTNTGNVPLTGVSIVESATEFSGTGTLPSPTFVSATAGSSATNLLVAGKATFTATYAITAADIAAGKVDNSAFANGLSPKNVAVKDTSDSKNPADYNETGTPSDPNGKDKTGTPIAENPKIAIVKGSALNLGTDGIATVGDIITYSYDVTNTGNVPLTGVSVVESATSFSGTGTLPSPTFVSATAGSSATNLLVGGSSIFTATYAITAADIAAGKVDNSAFANGLSPKNVAVKDTSDSKNPADYNETGTPSDPNGKDKTGTPIAENPKIAIVKGSALNLGTDGVASVGDIITYSYDVTNTGNVPLTGVSVVESTTVFSGTGTLPSPTFVSATAGSSATNLLVAGKATFTATYAITAADIATGKVDNSAFANGLSPKNVAVKDTSDSKNPADYNETGTPSDPNGEDKTGTPIAENPKIAIVKGSALNLGTDGIATVGDIITYSYDVTNTGNVPLTGVSVVESVTSFTGTGTLPSPTFVSATAGSSATNLLVGGSAVFTATYAITAADIAAGKVDNSAFANGLSPKNVAVKDTSDSKNPADYNETGTPSDPNGKDKTGTPIAENPKIAIVKGSALNLGTDGIATVGDIITYSYDVTNTGNVPLTGVSVVESATSFSGTGALPSPTFVSATAGSSATNLLVAGKATFTATYAITAADIASGKVDNSAFANGLSPKNVAVKDTSDSKNPADYNETGTPSDPNGKDKTGTPIAESPKITIVKGSALNLGTDGVASVGDIITYSYDVNNTGNVPLTGVSVVESATAFSGTGTLPSPTFVSATAGSSATNLLVAGKATFTAAYAITAADIAAGKVDNSAFANGLSPKNVAVKDTSDSKNPSDYNETGTPSDPNGKDKTGTPIAENPKIAIVKGSALNLGTDNVASVGDIITYSYEVTNTGNVTLTNVLITESLSGFTGSGTPPTPIFVSATQSSPVGTLKVGEKAIYTANYPITATDLNAGKVDNQAFASGKSPKNVTATDESDSKNTGDYNETGTPSDLNGKDKTGTLLPKTVCVNICIPVTTRKIRN